MRRLFITSVASLLAAASISSGAYGATGPSSAPPATLPALTLVGYLTNYSSLANEGETTRWVGALKHPEYGLIVYTGSTFRYADWLNDPVTTSTAFHLRLETAFGDTLELNASCSGVDEFCYGLWTTIGEGRFASATGSRGAYEVVAEGATVTVRLSGWLGFGGFGLSGLGLTGTYASSDLPTNFSETLNARVSDRWVEGGGGCSSFEPEIFGVIFTGASTLAHFGPATFSGSYEASCSVGPFSLWRAALGLRIQHSGGTLDFSAYAEALSGDVPPDPVWTVRGCLRPDACFLGFGTASVPRLAETTTTVPIQLRGYLQWQ